MQHIQGNGIGLKRPDGTTGKYGFANSQLVHAMLPAAQVTNGQAQVTYVLNNQSVAARLEPSQQSPLRAELKCMREMVPPIGTIYMSFEAFSCFSIFLNYYIY
jgi:hypothetical protein